MNNNFLIFDDFHNNVDEVRNYALGLDFNVQGNYPGLRTKPEETNQLGYLQSFFEELLHKKITYWPSEYNTSYQITLEDSETWVHHDDTEWAGVLYLTPDPLLSSGTSVYRHKETLNYKYHSTDSIDYNDSDDARDLDKWEPILSSSNIYNRLVLYKGDMYHRSTIAGFGTTKETGRLFQTFFFNTTGE